ncbi:MAG TPA: hypothetical protein VM101_08185 [Flavitalea sp.]|nr:hypothetical protein [Flavitalea sp.]
MDLKKIKKRYLDDEFLRIHSEYLRITEHRIPSLDISEEYDKIRNEMQQVLDELKRRRIKKGIV